MFADTKRVGRWLAIAMAIGLFCSSAALAKKPPKPDDPPDDDSSSAGYTIIPFAPDGVEFDSSGVSGLNEAGDVVGFAETENGQLSYHLDLDTGAYTPLPGRVWSVNGHGEIAGNAFADPSSDGYYLSALGAEPVLLSPLQGDPWVYVYSINDSRMIVGASVGGTGNRAVVWRPILNTDGTWSVDGPVPLLPLEGDAFSYAIDINNPVAGGPFEILGSSQSQDVVWTIDLNPDGTLTAPSGPVTLGTLDGSLFRGYANNSFGDVCGKAGHTPAVQPFDAAPQALNVVRNTTWGRAMDINDLGQCVGQIETVTKGLTSYPLDAYLWEGPDADPVKLEELIDRKSGWDELNYANYITNMGAIAGHGYYNGVARGFIMVPTP